MNHCPCTFGVSFNLRDHPLSPARALVYSSTQGDVKGNGLKNWFERIIETGGWFR